MFQVYFLVTSYLCTLKLIKVVRSFHFCKTEYTQKLKFNLTTFPMKFSCNQCKQITIRLHSFCLSLPNQENARRSFGNRTQTFISWWVSFINVFLFLSLIDDRKQEVFPYNSYFPGKKPDRGDRFTTYHNAKSDTDFMAFGINTRSGYGLIDCGEIAHSFEYFKSCPADIMCGH